MSLNEKIVFCFLIFVGFNCLIQGQIENSDLVEFDFYEEGIELHNTKLATCSLSGFPVDTSPSNLYTIDPISDNVESGRDVWSHPFDGQVNFTSFLSDPDKHYQSLSALWSGGSYRLRANSLTKQFTRKFHTRMMKRYVVLSCLPDGARVVYYLQIPVQDMTPPVFQQHVYNFSISSNWNYDRPISEGDFVIVSDNAYEIQENDSFLQYSTSPENILRVEPHRLWVRPDPEIFNYRLDIYLKESVNLLPGQDFQVALSVKDEFNTGHAIINISVK